MQQLSAREVLQHAPVIPVVAIEDVSHAVPLAEALAEGGIGIIEVTLRTASALAAIEAIARHCPDVLLGVGTVLDVAQLQQAIDAGARFIVTPGSPRFLLEAAADVSVPVVPGVSTASEIMTARALGFNELKFFPAEASGGLTAIRSFAGPFADIHFCPTGGITPASAADYLAQRNVRCVGGSWLVTRDDCRAGDWPAIRQRAEAAASLGKSMR